MTDQHKPGCEALGGYGHGVGPCDCGATPAPAQPEGAQEDEPVAWRIAASTVLPVGELTAIKGRADLAKHLGYAVEPLYLHPSRSAGAAAPVEGAPAGWQLVPIQPTKEMIDAGAMHTMRADEQEPYRARGEAIAAYMDMLTAAPKEKP